MEPLTEESPPILGEQVPVAGEAQPPELPRPWQEELSERVVRFRRRRARLRGEPEPAESLEFDFERENRQEAGGEFGVEEVELPTRERDLGTGREPLPASEAEVPVLDSRPLDRPEEEVRMVASAAAEIAQLPLDQQSLEPAGVEIILESSRASSEGPDAAMAPLVLPLAPMGRRFLAGLLDALVLLLAAGLFAVIFWRAGGHITMRPLNVAVVSFIAAFLIMAYFGLFTALTFTTPGLLWMGIEVRNLDGTFPTAREAFWRAFGYLVSTGALMLGFIWALVDSDGLTWHDRMSGTFLTVAESGAESQRSEAEG